MRRSRRKTYASRRINTKRILRKKNSLRRSKRYSKKNIRKKNTKRRNTKSRIRSRKRVNKRNTKRIRRKRRVMKGGERDDLLISTSPTILFESPPIGKDSSFDEQTESSSFPPVVDATFEPEERKLVTVLLPMPPQIMEFLKLLLNDTESYTLYANCMTSIKDNVMDVSRVENVFHTDLTRTCNVLNIFRVEESEIGVELSEEEVIHQDMNTVNSHFLNMKHLGETFLRQASHGVLGGGPNDTVTGETTFQSTEEIMEYFMEHTTALLFFTIIIAWAIEKFLDNTLPLILRNFARFVGSPVRLLLRLAKGIPEQDNVTLVIPSGLGESLRESLSSNSSSSSEQELELELELERDKALEVSVNAAKGFIEQAVEIIGEERLRAAQNSANDLDKREKLKQNVLKIKRLSTQFVTMIEELESSFFQNPMLEDPEGQDILDVPGVD